jgi:nitroreductase
VETTTTITSANSVFTIVIAGLFPAPVQLQGYASDKAFATEAVALAEVQMGVDGRMTGGYVPNPVKQTITLQADSPSKFIFAALIQATKTAREIFYISGTITLPSTGESFVLTRGILTNGKQIPDAQKVLQPQDFEITWESVNASPL